MDDAWVFDVDGTLVDEISGSHLRPLVREVLGALVDRGIAIVVWSAGGADYARRRLAEFDLDTDVAGFHGKSIRDVRGHWCTAELRGAHRPVVFVDDRPEDLAPSLEVVAVRPYLGGSPHDKGLAPVLDLALH